MLNQIEREYKSTTNRIGGTMLFFLGLLELLFFAQSYFVGILEEITSNATVLTVADSLTYDAAYLLSFMLPVLFFALISKKRKVRKAEYRINIPKYLPLMIIAGMGIITACAMVNSEIMSLFGLNNGSDFAWWEKVYPTRYSIVLGFIMTALVPAFCEEFLFRGMVLSNLRPYGNRVAIIGSAVLFSLMHQNPAQFFYTFCAGIVLGGIYVETNSIWGGVLLHLFNNFSSVLTEVIYDRYGIDFASTISQYISTGIIIAGFVCIVILIVLHSRKKAETPHPEFVSAIGMELPESMESSGLSPKFCVKGFFSPCMIIFIIADLSTVVLALLLGPFL